MNWYAFRRLCLRQLCLPFHQPGIRTDWSRTSSEAYSACRIRNPIESSIVARSYIKSYVTSMSLDKSKTKFTFHCKQEANATECPDAATTCASCFQNENGRRDRERFGTPQYWETDFKQCAYALDYLFAFNLMVRQWSLLPVIKEINSSGSLYTFTRSIWCLARSQL